MFWLGVVLSVIGGLWIVVNAFRTSVLWGLGSLLVPFVSLIFALMNFSENKIPLLISVIGTVLVFTGYGSYVESMALQGAMEAAQ
ncbi:MAG TPA: hypothetical protein VFR30_06485 [Lysobacter sp.]|nr:hypothetical protein [Lysobacter sp.]